MAALAAIAKVRDGELYGQYINFVYKNNFAKIIYNRKTVSMLIDQELRLFLAVTKCKKISLFQSIV